MNVRATTGRRVIVLGCEELARERAREAEEERAARVAAYVAFAEKNGGRLGDDLAGVLQGRVRPSGVPAPALATAGPCAGCGEPRRGPVPAGDDGLCTRCRPRCTHCGKEPRALRRTNGLCSRCHADRTRRDRDHRGGVPAAPAPRCRRCNVFRPRKDPGDGLCGECRKRVRATETGGPGGT